MTPDDEAAARSGVVGHGAGRLRSHLRWWFAERDGRITVAQFPNAPLVVWGVAAVLARFAVRTGTANAVLSAVAVVSLFVWAADEVVRGVNPWRRLLGGVVAAGVVAGLAAR